MTSPEHGAQQECKSTRLCPPGGSRTGRPDCWGEKGEDIELLVEHDHPGVNPGKIAHPAYRRFRSHIWRPACVDFPVLAAPGDRIIIHPRRHVLERHLTAGARALQPDGIRSMNLSIVDHAFAKKVPALIAFKGETPNQLEWTRRTIGENRDLRIRRLRRKILKRFVIDGR
jgi:hypothetical protein